VLSLRYLNPIGADLKMRTGLQLPKPTHALGKMMQAQEEGTPFQVTGTDYPTRDGSGIRDYIHLWDLAAAHVAALSSFDALVAPASTSTVINLGTGIGTTVRELLDAFNKVVSAPIRAQDAARRPGDIAGAYSRIDRARQLLDWQPHYGIAESIRHSLQWASMRDEVLSYTTAQPLPLVAVPGQDHASMAERPIRRPHPMQAPRALTALAETCAGFSPRGRSCQVTCRCPMERSRGVPGGASP
jgi:UDP-glucose 4-epimerase